VALLPNTTLQFYEEYRDHLDGYADAAKEAEEAIRSLLRGNVRGAQVTARAKTPLSLLAKLRRKHYGNPAAELTDLVGVRVITQYPDAANHVERILRPAFDINEEESSDKLDDLDPTGFGYRSIHLVAKQRTSDADIREGLGEMWFEIQVRSLLQHAWAEVDHDIKYKSGVDFPRALKRRLAAIAGGLETLDHAFIDMRATQERLIAKYRLVYQEGGDEDERFDAARLTACLDARRPEGASLTSSDAVVQGDIGSIGKVLNEALETVGINTARLLDEALSAAATKRVLKEHASAIGESPATLSHLIVGLVVVWTQNADVLNKQFPELRFDSALATTLDFEISEV
jgi:ppGpp synthetase/RelA/SpoT-type nucleotidyltranferase